VNLIVDFLWVLVTLAAVILVVVGIILVTSTARDRSRAKTSAPSVAHRVDGAPSPAGTPQERLHELAIRRAARQISVEEYAAAREEILRDL
jgi:uncharacterized membrane protein